eukprot:1630504-Rhodomonas_salina.1
MRCTGAVHTVSRMLCTDAVRTRYPDAKHGVRMLCTDAVHTVCGHVARAARGPPRARASRCTPFPPRTHRGYPSGHRQVRNAPVGS